MNATLLNQVKELRSEGMSQKDIAAKLGYDSILQLRSNMVKARELRRTYLTDRVTELYSDGKKIPEIADCLGISEARVYYYINHAN